MLANKYRRNANATVQCPVEPGPYSVKQTVELPKEIPHGQYLYLFSRAPLPPTGSRWRVEVSEAVLSYGGIITDGYSQVHCPGPRVHAGRRRHALFEPLCRLCESFLLDWIRPAGE